MKTNPHDPAFVNPIVTGYIQETGKPETKTTIHGTPLTKREFFSIMVLNGIMSCPSISGTDKNLVSHSVKIADLLVKELNGET